MYLFKEETAVLPSFWYKYIGCISEITFTSVVTGQKI